MCVVFCVQLVLDQWFLNNGGANNNASVDPSQVAATGKRAEVPPPSLTTGSSYSVSGVNSATVQVTAGQNVFVDIVATDGVNTVNLVSTVSFGAGGEASSVAVVTVAGGGAGGLGAGAIAGIVVGSVVGAVLLAALTTAVVAGVVVAVRRMKSRDTIQEHADEVRPTPFPPLDDVRLTSSRCVSCVLCATVGGSGASCSLCGAAG
jgi:hypothetical protein